MRKALLLSILGCLFTSAYAQLIPFGATWKYLDNGSNQGTAWRGTSFDDAAWKSGPAQLGYGDGDEATKVSYGPDASNKYITTYFRKTISITDVSSYTSFTGSIKRDDGAVVYVNGTEVYRSNLPTGTIAYNTLASTGAADDGNTAQNFSIPLSAFVNGTNVIAVEIHQNTVNNSDISFDLQIDFQSSSGTPASTTIGFTSVTKLNPVSVSTNTGEKPQAKVWTYAGKHWAVLPNSNGTFLYRLDGTTWTNVLKLSSKTSSKADCRVNGNVTHIFLFQGPSSQFVSVEYVSGSNTYQLWSKRTSTVGLSLETGVETATIDMDGAGRMWLAYAGTTSVYVRYSDSPYKTWSSSITVATGIKDDDICTVAYMPALKKIGVFWSNQNSQRFGFKTHSDGAGSSTWSSDEVPASQSALSIGGGMADDHLNATVASDGTLYVAAKTSYDNTSYPEIILLIRRPNGTWDKVYDVAHLGTRPIVVLNESAKKVRVVYTNSNDGGNILYRETPTDQISFSSAFTLISGTYNNSTSTHQSFTSEVVILASNSTTAVGVLAKDGTTSVIAANTEAPLMEAAPATDLAQVYPTLVKRGGQVTLQTKTSDEAEAVLVDGNGRVVHSYKFNGQTKIETNDLASGVYFIVIRSTKKTRSQKIIVTD